MNIILIEEEWLPFPAHYRCLFTIEGDATVRSFYKNLDTVEELEARDSSKIIKEIKEKYDRQT